MGRGSPRPCAVSHAAHFARPLTRLSLAGLCKRYGSVQAVDSASLEVRAGEIHAVCGENGAGKSTLLKMAAGIVVPDSGSVRIAEKTLSPHTPKEAIARGVGMVQQHFALVLVFTALENVVLGVEPTGPLGVLDLRAARSRLQTIAKELGADLPLDVPTESLGVGDRQRLEIARALYRDAEVLILDEPTAVLTPGEATALYATLRRLAAAGRAIVVVTHKLDEVRDHADVVTVMRRGRVLFTRQMSSHESGESRDQEVGEIAAAIMGGEASNEVGAAAARTLGEVVISARDVRSGRALRGFDLEVRAGEIVGVAGVEGNGQRELVRVLAGLDVADAGEVRVEGGLQTEWPPRVSAVFEDRQSEGLVLDADVRDNAILGELGRFSRHGLLDLAAIEREAARRVEHAGAPKDLDAPARSLSGGNQQKIVMARAIARVKEGTRALVLAHPTRGVDLGATRAIHRDIVEAAAAGAAVLVISADLHELRALSDRILVLARGRIVRELPATASDDEIGRSMLAAGPEGARA